MQIKWSKYNYLFRSEKYGYLLYNTLSGKIVSIPKVTMDNYFKDNESGVERLEEIPLFYMQMRSMLALLSDDEEEKIIQQIRLKRRLRQCKNHGLALTVAPTMDCNFACSYCYVKRSKTGSMDSEVQKALTDFICQWPGTREYCDINWFGGEPLLAFDCIKNITETLLHAGVPVQAALTTNGYLLNDGVIAALDDLNINSIHITIDGSQENHDKHRPLRTGEGSYDVILKNVHNLMSKWDKKCTLRVNLTSENYQEYPRYYEKLRTLFPQKNLFMYPGIIDNPPDAICKCNPNHKDVSNMLLHAYRTFGTNPRQYFNPSDMTNYCSVLQPNDVVIGSDGSIYKCWRDLGYTEMRIGSILNKNVIDAGTEILAHYMIGTDPFDDPECRKCIMLPVCSGGCPQQRVRAKYFGEKTDCCPYYKSNLPEYLEVYYEKSLKQPGVA